MSSLNCRIFLSFAILGPLSFGAGADTYPFNTKAEYIQSRNALVEKDNAFRFDSDLKLNDTEAKVNMCLVKYRNLEVRKYKNANKGYEVFPGAVYFPKVKSRIESSKLFPIIKRMPKGGALHVHSTLAGRAEWIVRKASTVDSCYVYWPGPGDSGPYLLGELRIPAAGKTPSSGFKLIRQVRATDAEFDTKLYRLITMGGEYDTSTDIWGDFGHCFKRITNFVQSDLVYPEYYADAFQTLLRDNVQYVELRAKLNQRNFLKQIADKIKRDTPAFDLKIIITNSRTSTSEGEVDEGIDKAVQAYRSDTARFIIGFDLAGHEDEGAATFDYLDTLLPVAMAESIPLFFHDGESNWPSDTNLYDAYLLRTRRIGHGFNLYLFPALEELLADKKTGIALEVCPISNQMLQYARDLRLHPGSRYLRRGVPCVLSSDDPLIFANNGLTYDFLQAFTSWELDLRALKKLAMNSIEYSGMSAAEKQKHMATWSKKWDAFIAYEYKNIAKELSIDCNR